MPSYCDMRRFQGIFQICANCCIPASIENVIRYYGGNFSQREFLDNFLEQYHMHDLSFPNVKTFLDKYPNFNICYESECKTIKEHNNVNGLVTYIEECLGDDSPVIVIFKEKTQHSTNIHAVTVVYKEENKIRYFDPNPQTGGFSKFIELKEFQPYLSPNLGTLVIKRKK